LVNKQSPGFEESGEESIGSLLVQLSSGRADLAWADFLKRHSPLIMQAARQFASGAEQASDCFLFVCEGLSDNRFRRLRSFRPEGPAGYRTWLKAVVANLCIDWRRKRDGRVRPFAAVAGLPPFEQAVYRQIFLRGMSRTECQRALATQFPGVTLEQVAAANAQLFKQLSSRQRWQLGHRSRGSVSLEDATSSDDEGPGVQPEDPGPGPEQLAGEWMSRDAINEALQRLAPRQRLLLRLRFVEDLTLDEVARLVGLPDPYRAHREIQAAIEELGRHLPREHP
jgi:RNA polymerase sigma factor (sigma-70 family)